MKKKRLYLVVESERREKNSRIFFAIIAAMNVYSVVISTKAKLYGVLKTKRSNLTKKSNIDTFELQKKKIKDSNEVEIKEIFPGVFCFEK